MRKVTASSGFDEKLELDSSGSKIILNDALRLCLFFCRLNAHNNNLIARFPSGSRI